ncbi:lipoyl(octanoyl) transferase LipB [Myxococcota bacterium]|nr:lipoyl(octanoyl) transferase LipB [Myxococcota bacterium]
MRLLGRVGYREAFRLQKALVAARTRGEVPDQLLLLEHDPVVTFHETGRGREHLLADPDTLAARGVAVELTDRGGDITFHGPGQLVGYPILQLREDERDLHRYLRDLEEVLIRTAASFGIAAARVPGLTGIWVGDAKLAAIGVKASRWVTHHGFALNVANDLSHFDLIVPCGIRDRGIASLSGILGREVTVDEAASRLVPEFLAVFGREWIPPGPLPPIPQEPTP